MKILISISATPKAKVYPLKPRKVNTDWYRIVIEVDKYDIPIRVVDIYRHRITKDWIVVYGNETDRDVGFKKVENYSAHPIAYTKLSSAKLYAIDYADWWYKDDGSAEPKRHADKYD